MILGHERQIQYLEKVFKNGRMSHAYLFYGPEHVGKFTVAKFVIEKLPCPYPIILDLENTLVSKKDKRKDIPIEDVRELKRLFSLSAPEGEWRIAIINQAEKLSPAASDALLKLLEEPGRETMILLITSSPEMLAPTIVSRTQAVRFSLVPEHILAGFLEKLVSDVTLRGEILSLASGRPGVTMELIENMEKFAGEKEFLKNIVSLTREKDIPEVFRFSETAAADQEKRARAVEYILRILRADFLKKIHTADPRGFVQRMKYIHRVAEALDTTNVNPRLALDMMLLSAISDTITI